MANAVVRTDRRIPRSGSGTGRASSPKQRSPIRGGPTLLIAARPAGADRSRSSSCAGVLRWRSLSSASHPDGHERAEEVATFRSTVPGLLGLADWLEAHGVTDVVMPGNRRLMEAGLGDSRRPVLVQAGQRAPRQAGGVGLAANEALLSDEFRAAPRLARCSVRSRTHPTRLWIAYAMVSMSLPGGC